MLKFIIALVAYALILHAKPPEDIDWFSSPVPQVEEHISMFSTDLVKDTKALMTRQRASASIRAELDAQLKAIDGWDAAAVRMHAERMGVLARVLREQGQRMALAGAAQLKAIADDVNASLWQHIIDGGPIIPFTYRPGLMDGTGYWGTPPSEPLPECSVSEDWSYSMDDVTPEALALEELEAHGIGPEPEEFGFVEADAPPRVTFSSLVEAYRPLAEALGTSPRPPVDPTACRGCDGTGRVQPLRITPIVTPRPSEDQS